MPEIISTPNALVQTTNGKRFYFYTGEIAVPNVETTMLSVPNIGERDIWLALEQGSALAVTDDMVLKVKSNGLLVMAYYIDQTKQTNNYGFDEIRMILPANTSLVITMTNVSSSTGRNMLISGYGKYLSM